MDNFIDQSLISRVVCEQMIECFESNPQHVHYDEQRNYHRLNSAKLPDDLCRRFTAELKESLYSYHRKWPWCDRWSSPIKLWEFNVQKYEPGNCYDQWHIESGGPVAGKPLRKLTWMTYLNNVESGGETQFLYQSVKFKPSRGITLIWPAGWTHPHRGLPAEHEVKYIATGWFVYDEQNKEQA